MKFPTEWKNKKGPNHPPVIIPWPLFFCSNKNRGKFRTNMSTIRSAIAAWKKKNETQKSKISQVQYLQKQKYTDLGRSTKSAHKSSNNDKLQLLTSASSGIWSERKCSLIAPCIQLVHSANSMCLSLNSMCFLKRLQGQRQSAPSKPNRNLGSLEQMTKCQLTQCVMVVWHDLPRCLDIKSYPEVLHLSLKITLNCFILVHDIFVSLSLLRLTKTKNPQPQSSLPSGNQTWLAGKSTIELGDCPG